MIEKFEHVTAETKANVYFDGKVISHTLWLADGEKRTLGIFMPGAYEFGTADAEIMDLTDGECEVQLPGSDEWKKPSKSPPTANTASAATSPCSTSAPT